MTDRRTLITSLGAGLLLAASRHVLAAGMQCAPADCITCGPTGSSTAGPFYVSNTPATMDINLLHAPGTPMRVSGIVLGGRDGRSVLAGAKVELWQADSEGRYHPEDNGDIARYQADEINLRGQVATGVDGRFTFRSIVPAHYGNRRRHLHWRLVADGHVALVTQTYWQDERGTARERRDFVDRNPEECRWIAFRNEGAVVAGEVVFVLRPAA
ncbi:MAG: hypothetical protein Q7J47_20430 [Azoarcus sp.]|nr:hypothetical protein [Azoarcus sp.]